MVDDEVSLRQMLVQQLRDGGYHVLEAGYGMEALEVAGSSPVPIHLVLSDIQMPGMLGTELARRLWQSIPGPRWFSWRPILLDELTSASMVAVLSAYSQAIRE